MRFEPLELFVRIEIGVLVVESDNHSYVDEIGLHVIEESPGVCARINWPAHCVLHISRLEKPATRIHLPNLLQAYSVELRIALVSQLELLHYLLRKRASSTFGKDCLFGNHFNARRKVLLPLTFF